MAGASKLGETQFRIVCVSVGVLVAFGVLRVRFCGVPPLPSAMARPEEPALEPGAVSASSKANPLLYAARIERDSETLGVRPSATVARMSAAFEHRVDSERRVLAPGESAKVLGLVLSVAARHVEGEAHPTLVLEIANQTEDHLAYNITTRPSRGTQVCARKPTIAHNAIAVAPHAAQTRSECIYKRGWRLEIQQVETVALPALSFHYVSRLPPTEVGLEPRLTRGHASASGSVCSLMLPAAARNGLATGSIKWFDIIDFFSRHPCDVFQFPPEYRAFRKDGERALPVVPE